MNNFDRNKTDFSFTDKLNEYTRNEEWKSGLDIVKEGKLNTFPDGKIDFNTSENYSTLWYTLSSAFEEIGNDTYTHISHLIESVKDIDVCTIHALKAIAQELNVDDPQIFDLPYPLEIEGLVNLLSISRNKLLTSGAVISVDAINSIYDDIGVSVSGAMGGYELSAWNTTQSDFITDLSGNYVTIPLTAWTDFIDTQISTCLLTNINLDGVVNDYKAQYDNNPNNDPLRTPDDSDAIEDLKIQYKVDKDFHATAEADKITLGITKLHEYRPNEIIILEAEFDSRDSMNKYGDEPEAFRRFKYDRERKVRTYIGFVEALNVYSAGFTSQNDSFYVSGDTPVSFFAETSAGPVSGDLIENTTHALRNIVLKTSYQRDYLKNVSRKHAIVGTSRIVQTIVSEYIARNFSSNSYWGYHTFEGVSSPATDISNLEVIDEELSSNILGDIKVIEYFDSTEYMNISASTDPLTSVALVNERFWEGDIADTAQLLSEHTSAEVSSFYKNLGLNLTADEIQNFINHVYDMGAITATMYPQFGFVPFDLPLTGTFGEYGEWETDGTTLYLSADILPIYEYLPTAEYPGWIGSPLISSFYGTSAEFLTDWLNTPEASAWTFGISIDTVEGSIDLIIDNSTFNFDNVDLVSAWIVNTYETTGWVENEVNEIWADSDLLKRLPLDDFNSAWAEKPVVSAWTDFASVSSPLPPFDRLDWASVPEFIDYINLSGTPTASEWASSDFVRSWNEDPFDNESIGVIFDQETDWALSSNPFVSGWLSGDPFESVFTNSAAVTSVSAYANSDEVGEALYSVSAIGLPSGGYDSNLSGMYIKYSGEPSGSFVPANHKNTVHPSIAYQPYIWNLIEALVTNIFFEDIYTPTILEFEDLSGRIDENGAVINMWRNQALDFTGYRTYYEDAKNFNDDLIEDERIDADGPWHAPALKSFLDPTSGQTAVMLSTWYDHLNLTDLETAKVSGQLETFQSNIFELSSKVIYNYGVDGFGNHYTLFKDDDNFETIGEVWLRYRNHPLSFPIIDSSETNQVQFTDFSGTLSGEFKQLTNACYDLGVDYVGTKNLIWMYGTDSATPLNPAADEYEVFAPIIEKAPNSFEVTLERWPSLFLQKRISRDAFKYVGTYTNNNDFVIAKLKKPTRSSENDPALLVVSGVSFDTFTVDINWDVENFYTGASVIKTKAKGLKYAEFDPTNNSQWRLSKGEDTITIAFESEAPAATSAESFLGSSGYADSPFDPNENECSGKIFENGITVLDFDIGSNTSIGDSTRDPKVSYYYGYTNVTYQGINANNGITTTPRNYDVLSGDDNCLPLQYFGNTDTSASFLINNNAQITCTNNGAGDFGIVIDGSLLTWETINSNWEDLTATTWETSGTSAHFFSYPGEIYPSGSTIPTSGYYVRYNGPGCHLFEVCYDGS
jgi:hypothetical protein